VTRALTPVPATLPGVVRRCTPLVTVEPVFVGCVACAAGMQCTTGAAADSAGRVRAICAFGSISLPIACLAVDLTDATGRAHGVWALAAHAGLPDPEQAQWFGGRVGEWLLWCNEDIHVTYSAEPFGYDWPGWVQVPALAGVTDRAEALARVLVHVLGGAQ
jgi:hypothetical protein